MQVTLQQHAYLHEMGIDVWQLNQASQPNASLDAPHEQVANSSACEPQKEHTHTVFGAGNENADLMIICATQKHDEGQQSEPFAERPGQLLDAMLQAIGLKRDDIYITNILTCHPDNNHEPSPDEVILNAQLLSQQIKDIQPKILCAAGQVAAHHLLDTKLTLDKLRNKTHHYGEGQTPLLVTYHPADLLQNPTMKNKAYMDLLNLKQKMAK